MIFVTVGTQIPFDRMVGVVDAWAKDVGEDVVAQVGPSEQEFTSLRSMAFLGPSEFEMYFLRSSLVVAHAGMGSILTALSFSKPIVIMPRRASLGEHRNDHQIATAKKYLNHPLVRVVWEEEELRSVLISSWMCGFKTDCAFSDKVPESFLINLRKLIDM